METYTIHHEVGIKASPEAVYQALTDTKKLAGWWTSDTRGNGAEVGGVLEFSSEIFVRNLKSSSFNRANSFAGKLIEKKVQRNGLEPR